MTITWNLHGVGALEDKKEWNKNSSFVKCEASQLLENQMSVDTGTQLNMTSWMELGRTNTISHLEN